MEEKNIKKIEAALIGIAERTSDLEECERSLDELERLLETAGGECFAKLVQVKEAFDPRTCIGSGKVRELSELCENNGLELAVFDFELSPSQIRNLENDLGGGVRVLDRSMLILDIFALHAVTGEGKLQVELAQLKYSAPRLIGHGTELSRQGGGIGSRGPGESKLETDRRHLKERVTSLERRLDELEHNRSVMRAKRDRSGIFKVAIVGYTNAGKSTLLNYLTDADILSEDKLFATLDPTTRKMELPSGEEILLTDTVGFIRKLPHHLIKAFRSTLDEVKYADLLLIVTDINDPESEAHVKVTCEVIADLDASEKPILYVYNKCDLSDSVSGGVLGEDSVAVSAVTGEGISDMIAIIDRIVNESKKPEILSIGYNEQSLISDLYSKYSVDNVEYLDTCIEVKVKLDGKGRGIYKKYIKVR